LILHRTIRLQALPGHHQPQLLETAERDQVRANEGSVRHVEVFQMGSVRTPIIGRPRHLPRHRRAATRYTLNCEEPDYDSPATEWPPTYRPDYPYYKSSNDEVTSLDDVDLGLPDEVGWTLRDVCPLLRFPLAGDLFADATVADVAAAGRLRAFAEAAAIALLSEIDRRLSDLLPALEPSGALGLSQADIPLALFQRRTSRVLTEAGLTTWSALAQTPIRDLFDLRQAGRTTVLDILSVVILEAARALSPTSADITVPSAAEPMDPVLRQVLDAVQLLATWSVREGRAVSISELIGVTTDQLPLDVAQTLLKLGQIDPKQLAHPQQAGADLGLLAEDMLSRLSGNRRVALERRVLSANPDTLDKIGDELGVTREAVRLNQGKATDQFWQVLAEDAYLPLRWRAFTLASSLGAAAPASSPLVAQALKAATRDSSHHEQLVPILLLGAGLYRLRDGWWVRSGASVPAVTDLLTKMGSTRFLSTEEASEWLAAQAIDPLYLEEWVEAEPQLKMLGDRVLNWSRSVVDKCVTLLQIWARPATAEELVEGVGEGHSVRGTKNRFFEDSRFMRVNRNDWALREWGGEEYTGIAEEIEQRINEWGGRAKLTDLVTTLVEQFGVSPGSVRVYAEAVKFVVEDGWVRLRTPEDSFEPRKTLPRTRGLYHASSTTWTYLLPVDLDVLRGSGRNCPEVLARAAALQPDSEAVFTGPSGPLRLTWTLRSAFGPSLGSTRALATGVGAEVGDELRIDFDLSDNTYSAVRVKPETVANTSARTALELITGLELRDGELAAGLAAAIEVTVGEVVGALRRRGDERVAELLPRPADRALTEALEELAGLFDSEV